MARFRPWPRSPVVAIRVCVGCGGLLCTCSPLATCSRSATFAAMSRDRRHLVLGRRQPRSRSVRISGLAGPDLGAGRHRDHRRARRVVRHTRDRSGERLLASNLYDYLMDRSKPGVFAFNAGGHVIYNYDDTGHSFGVASVALDRSAPTVWSTGASFLETPRLDQVVLVEPVFATSGTSRLPAGGPRIGN